MTPDHKLSLVVDAKGNPVRDLQGLPIVQRVKRHPEYLLGPDGRRLLDAQGRTIPISQAEAMAGVPAEETGMYPVEVVLDDAGVPAYRLGVPVLKRGPRRLDVVKDGKGKPVRDPEGNVVTESTLRLMAQQGEVAVVSKPREQYVLSDDGFSSGDSTESQSSVARRAVFELSDPEKNASCKKKSSETKCVLGILLPSDGSHFSQNDRLRSPRSTNEMKPTFWWGAIPGHCHATSLNGPR